MCFDANYSMRTVCNRTALTRTISMRIFLTRTVSTRTVSTRTVPTPTGGGGCRGDVLIHLTTEHNKNEIKIPIPTIFNSHCNF
ncbi:hypothetical protein Hdeb2414_s0013g00416921 [Helianthus debilis subsp. tardiflorus]